MIYCSMYNNKLYGILHTNVEISNYIDHLKAGAYHVLRKDRSSARTIVWLFNQLFGDIING